MPSFVYKLTITTSGKHRETETTTEIFSTLLSANRAAYVHHQGYGECYDDNYLDPVDDVRWDVSYRANFQEDKYTEIDIDVERVEIGGPDLSRGEVDEKHSRWKVQAGLNEDGEDDDDDDDDDEDEADSSEVEIVEPPPAKRVKLNAENPKD